MISTERCFRGLQKTTLLDFPETVSCVLFVGGCNFNCPYCYNSSLVRREEPEISWNFVWEFLNRRKNVLGGICVSGGEPTLAPFLPDFLVQAKKFGLKIKLDTNGYNPSILRVLIEQKLLDFVALDVKNSPDKYELTSGLKNINLDYISESINILRTFGIDHELRTTITEEMHTVDDIQKILDFVGPGNKYVLQPVRHDVLCLSRTKFIAPSAAVMKTMEEVTKRQYKKVTIRSS